VPLPGHSQIFQQLGDVHLGILDILGVLHFLPVALLARAVLPHQGLTSVMNAKVGIFGMGITACFVLHPALSAMVRVIINAMLVIQTIISGKGIPASHPVLLL